MHNRYAVPFAIIALGATMVSGCGNANDGADEGTTVSIASLMGQETEFSPEQQREQEAQIQDLVAQCMTEQGWEYIPIEYPDAMYDYSVDSEDELERRQREGYGIAYWTLNQGNDEALVNDPLADWVDPNQAIVAEMSESESTAYYEALYGTPEEQEANQTVEVDPDTGEEYYMQTGYGPGCQGEAYAEVYGDSPMQSEGYWEAVSVFYEELQTRVDADSRVKALNSEWSRCMTEAGFEYASPNDIWETAYADLQTRHDEIVGDLFNQDPFEGWAQEEIDAFFESASQEEMDQMFNSAYELTDEQREALEALLADEITLAVAEYQCSLPYNEEYQTVYAQIEEDYALEHQAELEQLAASLGVDS
jgi:hypothetical protein